MNNPNENPYVGPRTFQQTESAKFFGRDQEARDLLNLIISDRMVLFYAQSGAGKSSLINTRIIPGLEKKGFEVLPVGRVGGDLPSGCPADNIFVFNLMRSLHEHQGGQDGFAGLGLATFLARLNKDDRGYFYDPRPFEAGDAGEAPETGTPEGSGEEEIWPRALIIDQFEELLSTHPEAWEQRDGFFTQLANAAGADPYLWVVLVMREDYVASLAPYTHLLPGGLRARYYMQQMGREAAMGAVKAPVEGRWRFDEGVAEQLVDDLSKIKVQKPDGSGIESLPGPYVEPVQLQVVCYRLWESLGAGHGRVTGLDLQGIGDVDLSLANYYSDRVAAVAGATDVPERKIRDWFGRQLITGHGVRGQVLRGETTSGEMENEVVQLLQDAHLVRFENRGGATWIELTHDRLVEPIRADNAEWTQRNLSMLQRAAELWEQQDKPDGLLLNDQSLVDAQRWADKNPDELTELDKDFLSACWDVLKREKLERDLVEREQTLKLEAAQKLAEEKSRSAKKLRQRAVVLVVLLGTAIVLTLFSVFSTLQARYSQATAVAQRITANTLAAMIADNSTQEGFRRATLNVQTATLAAQIAQLTSTAQSHRSTSAALVVQQTGTAQVVQLTGTAQVVQMTSDAVATNAALDEVRATSFAGQSREKTQLVATQTAQARYYESTIDGLLKTIKAPPTETPTPSPSPTATAFAAAPSGPPYAFANATIHDVRVDKAKIDVEPVFIAPDTYLRLYTYRGQPGEEITLNIDYVITMLEFCPFCIHEIQVGFSHTDPLDCIYIGIPEKRGTKGSGEIAVTLPEKPGTYFLAFDHTLDYTCPVQWGSGLPDIKKDRYFLKIDVLQ